MVCEGKLYLSPFSKALKSALSKDFRGNSSLPTREKKRKKKVEEELLNICNLIHWLDGMRVFRRKSPAVIEDTFKCIGSKKLSEKWNGIRRVVEEIAFMAEDVPGVPTLIKVRYCLVRAHVVVGLLILLLFYFKVLTVYSILYALTATTLLFVATIFIDLIIRKKVVKFEEKHKREFRKAQMALKDLVQDLIFELIKRIDKYEENPRGYKIEVFHKDYKGVQYIKEKRKPIGFLPKFSTYIITPSVPSKTQLHTLKKRVTRRNGKRTEASPLEAT